MTIGAYLKKRLNLFIGSLIFILVAVLATFIILNRNNYENKTSNNKNIRVTLLNDDGIMFGEYPMTLEEGFNNSPDNIYTIVNKSKSNVKYEVIVSDDESPDSLDKRKVGVCVDDTCGILSDFDEGIIYTSNVKGKEETNINLKFFVLKDKYTQSDLNKSILLTVEIREK